MGMYGGYLSGRRARKEDDLRQSQFGLQEQKFAEEQKQYGLSGQRQDRAYGLQEQKFQEDKVQTGLQGIRSDREYQLRKKQMEEQARRSEEGLGLSKRAAARADAEAQRKADEDRQKRAADRYGNAYQAALMGDEDEAVRIFNMDQDPMKHVTGITIDADGNMMIDRRGKVGKVPYDQIRRYLPRDPTEGVARSGGLTGGLTGDQKTFAAEQGWMNAQDQYDIPTDQDTGRPKTGYAGTFKAGVKVYGSPEGSAAAMGLQMKLPPPVKEMIGGLDAAIRGMQEAGVTGPQFDTIVQQRDMMLDGIVQKDPVVQAANQALVKQFSSFDTNQDQQINELDADYQEAQQVMDLIGKNPQARSAALARFGAAQIAEWEALVTAVKKRAALTAQRRVGLGG